jgi:hypothetical protein
MPDGSLANAFSVKADIRYENHYLCLPGGSLLLHQAEVRSFLAEHCGQAQSINYFFGDAGQQVRVGTGGDRWPISCGSAIEWRTDHPWTMQEIGEWWVAHCAPAAVGTFADYSPAQRKALYTSTAPKYVPKAPAPRLTVSGLPALAPAPTYVSPTQGAAGLPPPPSWIASTSCDNQVIFWDHVPSGAEIAAWARVHCGQK